MPYLHLWKLTGAQTKPSSIIFSQVFCSAAIDQKRKLYKKAIGSKLSLDWQTFKFERRRVSWLLRHIRRTYVVRTLNVNKTDRKGFWREIGKKIHFGKHRPTPGCAAVARHDGTIVMGTEAANVMNNYGYGPKTSKEFHR